MEKSGLQNTKRKLKWQTPQNKTLNRKLKTDYTNPTKSGGELYKWHQKQAQLPFIVCLFDVV